MFPHVPLLRCTVVRPVRPYLDLWKKPERIRGFLALLYLHSAFMGRLSNAQLFFLFIKIQNCCKKYSIFYYNFFYVMKVISFCPLQLLHLSLTFNSCHCTLLFHSPAQVQPHHNTTSQHSVGRWCRGQHFRQTPSTTMGRWHWKIWDTEGSI